MALKPVPFYGDFLIPLATHDEREVAQQMAGFARWTRSEPASPHAGTLAPEVLLSCRCSLFSGDGVQHTERQCLPLQSLIDVHKQGICDRAHPLWGIVDRQVERAHRRGWHQQNTEASYREGKT